MKLTDPFKSVLDKMVKNEILIKNGDYRWTFYSINQNA